VRDIGTIVRARRRELGWSQTELAVRSGTSRTFVADLEAGKPTAELGRTLRLIDALDLRLTLGDPTSTRIPAPAWPNVDLDHVLEQYGTPR